MSNIDVTNPCYDYEASAELKKDCWRSLVTRTLDLPDPGLEGATLQLKAWGDQYKEQSGKAPANAYATAASVIRSALKYCIPLVEDDGAVRGKSAVEADIKAAKGEDAKSGKTPWEKVLERIASARRLCRENGLSFDDALAATEEH